MKIVDGFKLRAIGGENIVAGEGTAQLNFNKLIALNATAAWLWNELEGVEFDVEMVAGMLHSQYDITEEMAHSDAKAIVERWAEIGIIE